MSSSVSRIYESGEYYQKVTESANGLERECVEEKKWQRGEPFAEPFSFRAPLSPTRDSFSDNFHQYSPLYRLFTSTYIIL
uniref:Uncharacterized protein n=1 Tax=Syphacia muris TaxID=451379 RepID=A0A0N5AF14_9BILA